MAFWGVRGVFNALMPQNKGVFMSVKKIRISIRLSENNYDFVSSIADNVYQGNKSRCIDNLIYILRDKDVRV